MSVLKYVRRGYTFFFLCVVAALAAVLCGCSGSDGDSDARGLAGQYWQSAAYTLDEIDAKFHPVLYNYERVFKPDDVSEDALHAYNVMLGYAEGILGQEYYVYDYYYADWTEPPNSWLIKVVPYDMARTAEDRQMKPILIRYCVTEVRMFTFTEDEYYDLLERFTVLA